MKWNPRNSKTILEVIGVNPENPRQSAMGVNSASGSDMRHILGYGLPHASLSCTSEWKTWQSTPVDLDKRHLNLYTLMIDAKDIMCILATRMFHHVSVVSDYTPPLTNIRKHWMPFPSSSLNPREFSCWTSRPRAPPKPSSVPSFRSKSLSASSGEARSEARTYNRTCFHDCFYVTMVCGSLFSAPLLGVGTRWRYYNQNYWILVQHSSRSSSRDSGQNLIRLRMLQTLHCLKRQHFFISEILIKWSCEKYPEKINAHFDWLASVWGKMEDTGILAVSCVCFWGRWTSQWTCILTTSW